MTTKEEILNHKDLMHMLKWAVKKLKVAQDEMDDVIQTTMLNITKGKICETNTVTTNITHHMRWVLMRKNTKEIIKRQVNLRTNYYQPSTKESEDSHEAFDIREWLNTHARSLERNEQIVLTSVFLEGETLETTGKKIGLTRERVRQIKEKALSKLRTLCNESDLVRN